MSVLDGVGTFFGFWFVACMYILSFNLNINNVQWSSIVEVLIFICRGDKLVWNNGLSSISMGWSCVK